MCYIEQFFLWMWDVQTGKLKRKVYHYGSFPIFSPDDTLAASATSASASRVWVQLLNIKTAQPLRGLLGIKGITYPRNSVTAIAFSPDGRSIAGVNGKRILLWDVRSGKLIRVITAGRDMVSSVAFRSDNKTLVAVCWDSTIELWDTQIGKLKRTLPRSVRVSRSHLKKL